MVQTATLVAAASRFQLLQTKAPTIVAMATPVGFDLAAASADELEQILPATPNHHAVAATSPEVIGTGAADEHGNAGASKELLVAGGAAEQGHIPVRTTENGNSARYDRNGTDAEWAILVPLLPRLAGRATLC
jgi:hypothetical protein